jgi:Ferritin-like
VASSWTPLLVQQHARAAVSVELYTLPFYLTVMTSLFDTANPIYQTIFSVAMEEMLHLQLAANLCIALGTTPSFTAPVYGTPIPFLDPDDPETAHYALINAILGPFNQQSLDTMLDIETPDEFESRDKDHTSPDYPYHSIGELYDALLAGIGQVGESQFPWKPTNQIDENSGFFGPQSYSMKITSLADAKAAVMAINEQGEGKMMNPVPKQPFNESQFPVDANFQLANAPNDPSPMNTFAHFGRFVAIQTQVNSTGWPRVYPASSSPNASVQTALKKDFASLISSLNSLWNGGNEDLGEMFSLINDLATCWSAQVIPQWT